MEMSQKSVAFSTSPTGLTGLKLNLYNKNDLILNIVPKTVKVVYRTVNP